MDVGIRSVRIQGGLHSLDLFVSFGLGISIRHSNIQAVFLQGNGVVSLGARSTVRRKDHQEADAPNV